MKIKKWLPAHRSKLTAPKGFTLIELVVVIVIIGIVMTIGTNTYQVQRAHTRYNDSILGVLTLVKTARNNAQSSATVFDETIVDDPQTPADERLVIPEQGYGVYFSRSDQSGESRIILFANTKADDPVSKNQYDPEEDMMIEEKKLDVNVIFSDILLNLKPVLFVSKTNPDENEAVMIFRPNSGDTILAANDHPLSEEDLTMPSELYLEFKRLGADPEAPAQYIHLSSISGIAEIN